jgi:hypothetical protein
MTEINHSQTIPVSPNVFPMTQTPFNLPKQSNYTCYMFGNRPGGMGMCYTPAEGQVPNRFVRFMMRICFDCKWVKDTP